MKLKIGDFVKYKEIKGQIVEIVPTISEYGDSKGEILNYIKIQQDNLEYHTDYYYVFTKDIEKAREIKINTLLNGIS